jgi:hypothetical protein
VLQRVTSSNQQNLTYAYDPTGNVTSITDGLFTASRTFQYDYASRLRYAQGTFGTNQANKICDWAANTLNYDPIGNILNKCAVAFVYGDGMHPSAVTSISSGKTYTYDANGNMLTRGIQNIAWDVENRLGNVSTVGGTTYMGYDYTGMRVKKNAPAGITLFPFQG